MELFCWGSDGKVVSGDMTILIGITEEPKNSTYLSIRIFKNNPKTILLGDGTENVLGVEEEVTVEKLDESATRAFQN